jgi:hypothetical protein
VAATSPARRAKPVTACCLFCGRPWTPGVVSKSDEHVLGQWIRRLEENHPAEQRSYSTGFELDEDAKELIEAQPQVIVRKAALLTLKTREVCEDCNKGWMSDLEEAAKPTILLLARSAKAGIAVSLSREAARRLSIWAQKTALTYELTSAGPHVGNVAMGQQLRHGNPLRGSLVWVGRHPQDYDISIGLAQIDVSATPVPQPGPPDRQVLLVSIVYHYVSILVFITNSPGQAWPPLSLTQWMRVWPSFGLGVVEYPPISSVNGTELTEIFTHPGRWMPPVHVPIVRRPDSTPEVRYKN